MAFTIAALVLVAIVVLWFTFRYYPEKKAAEHFFDALVGGDTARAYQLWKPSPSYAIKDFLADWGPEGYYGPVKSYKILRASSPIGANAIAVRVAISPFKDFLADWGPEGYYGPVKSYKILRASSPIGANAIAVRVAISPFSPMPDASEIEKSRKTKVVSVWVLISDKSFSFPP